MPDAAPTADEKLQKKIDAKIAQIAKLDEQIGRLMSRRVDLEEALAILIGRKS